jgi:hypothetical protein
MGNELRRSIHPPASFISLLPLCKDACLFLKNYLPRRCHFADRSEIDAGGYLTSPYLCGWTVGWMVDPVGLAQNPIQPACQLPQLSSNLRSIGAKVHDPNQMETPSLWRRPSPSKRLQALKPETS